MLVFLCLIYFLSCLFNANGYPVQRGPSLLLTYLPESWMVIGQSSRRVDPFAVADPTQTLICRVMLPVLNLSSMMRGDESLPLFILAGEPQFVLRRRVSHKPDFEVEPWEVLAYTPNANSQEPDITSLLAAPAPVLCVSPDRPRPHPVLLAPPLSPEPMRPSQRPSPSLHAPPYSPLYSVQASPAPQGFPIEPSVNPVVLESLINSVQNRPVFVTSNRVEQSPNGHIPFYKPQHDSSKSENTLLPPLSSPHLTGDEDHQVSTAASQSTDTLTKFEDAQQVLPSSEGFSIAEDVPPPPSTTSDGLHGVDNSKKTQKSN